MKKTKILLTMLLVMALILSGMPLSAFAAVVTTPGLEVSDNLTVDTIIAGDTEITGTGLPGQGIEVTFPGGTTVNETVDASGNWMVNVPGNVTISPDDEITVEQIIARDGSPSIDVEVINLTTGLHYARNGDTLQYTFYFGNEGDTYSVLSNTIVQITFREAYYQYLDFDGIVLLDGNDISSTSYCHIENSATLEIYVYIGDILVGDIHAITIELTVSGESSLNSLLAEAGIGIDTITGRGYSSFEGYTFTPSETGETANIRKIKVASSYTVSYNANGGNGSYTVSDLAKGDKHTVLSGATTGIYRLGYTLMGWNTKANGTGTYYAMGSQIEITGSLTLYAVWRLNDTGTATPVPTATIPVALPQTGSSGTELYAVLLFASALIILMAVKTVRGKKAEK